MIFTRHCRAATRTWK